MEERICPICLEGFIAGQSIDILISNGALFPNKTLHSGCFNGQETVVYLTNSYKEYKEALEKYRMWT